MGGAAAWALVLSECDQGTSDLEILDIMAEFEAASIEKSVGYSADTITMYARELNSLNARLPTASKYSPDKMSIKLLSSIVSPETLALQALAELKADAGSRRFERQVTINGNQVRQRDYAAIVAHFDSMWRGLFKQGIIRTRAPGRRHDAGALEVAEDDDANEVTIQGSEWGSGAAPP